MKYSIVIIFLIFFLSHVIARYSAPLPQEHLSQILHRVAQLRQKLADHEQLSPHHPHLFHFNPQCPQIVVLTGETGGLGHSFVALAAALDFAFRTGVTLLINPDFQATVTHGVITQELFSFLALPSFLTFSTQSQLRRLLPPIPAPLFLSFPSLEELDALLLAQRCNLVAYIDPGGPRFCSGWCLFRPDFSRALRHARAVLAPHFWRLSASSPPPLPPHSPALPPLSLHVVLHLRLGDVHFRATDTDYFQQIVRQLHRSLSPPAITPALGPDPVTVHYTVLTALPNVPGGAGVFPVVPEALAFLIDALPAGASWFLNDLPVNDLWRLLLADVMVCSESSFSAIPATLSSPQTLVLLPPQKELFDQHYGQDVRNMTLTQAMTPREDVIFLDWRGRPYDLPQFESSMLQLIQLKKTEQSITTN